MNNKVEKTFFELSGVRRRWILVLFLLGFLTLILRAFYLQSVNKNFLQEKATATSNRVISLLADRGKITDRYGNILARSTPVFSVNANPKITKVKMNKDQRVQLESILKLSSTEIDKKIFNSQKDNVYLKRRVPPSDADQLKALKIPGITFENDFQRFYPAAEVAANLVGCTNMENVGQEGIELAQNKSLSGVAGRRKVLKDKLGRTVDDIDDIKLPQEGNDITLSIDRRIQYLTYRELAKSIEEHKAQAGSAVVINAKTGEILALANLPTYNPNNLNAGYGPTRNRAVTDVFEPGSTMKPFVVSAALDSGIIRPNQVIDTSAGFMKIGAFVIHDLHAEPGKLSMTVSEVIAKSSNVGAARIGLMQDPKSLWGTLNKVGFGMRTNVGFPGEVGGVLRNYKNWGMIGQATVSYGYGGINLTLLQLAQSYTVFANDGELKPITLYKRNEPVIGTKVFKKETVRTMVEMMEGVIEEGTGGNAKVKGYRVAGKTGTAEKSNNGKYEKNKNIGSFVGLIPATNPRIIMAVMIDEPSVGSHFGNAVAAPVFSNVMTDVMKILNVPQDDKLQNKILQQEKAEPKETI
ncbi:MAG: penicillin-binding protein 2 [Candidatus Methylopumilus sp.]|nr:penicillin-binding protein 2 [Candidatus Methylopumilus sp.]